MTQSHLIVKEEGIKIYKDDPASAILCEDQERAMQLIVEHHFMSSGHLVPPAFDFPYPVPGIEFEVKAFGCEADDCPSVEKCIYPEMKKGHCIKVARLIEHTESQLERCAERLAKLKDSSLPPQ
jgi:hypothetical protein